MWLGSDHAWQNWDRRLRSEGFAATLAKRSPIAVLQRIRNYRDAWRRRRYDRLAATAERPVFSVEQLRADGYHSQCGQDKWIVERLLPEKTHGIFVEIGANDGVTISNTWLLEQRGWTGLAVEPLPDAYARLVQNRRCVAVNGCVAPRPGRARFRVVTGYAEMLSGLEDAYDARHRMRIEQECRQHGGTVETIDVTCYRLNDLLERHGLYNIDYLSIDVEGAEYGILSDIDFNRFGISVIGVENNYLDHRIPSFLGKRGFAFHSVVGDEFYCRHDLV